MEVAVSKLKQDVDDIKKKRVYWIRWAELIYFKYVNGWSELADLPLSILVWSIKEVVVLADLPVTILGWSATIHISLIC